MNNIHLIHPNSKQITLGRIGNILDIMCKISLIYYSIKEDIIENFNELIL